MRNTIIFLVSSVMGLSFLQSACGFSGSGSGAQTNPYIITNAAQLQEMQNELFAWYQLGNDIDASETKTWNNNSGFVPVGSQVHPFVGHLIGGGFTISGLYIYQVNNDFVGLFGKVSSTATIENVVLADPNITGRNNCGALAGYTDVSPVNGQCVRGKIIGNDYVGGLLGCAGGQFNQPFVALSNCISVLVETHAHDNAGGLAGQSGPLTNCNSSGIIQANSNVGGLVGNLSGNGPMGNCSSTVNVSATGGNCGGLIGNDGGGNTNITNCYADGNVTGVDNVGGLCGNIGWCCGAIVSFSYATGDVESYGTVGGLIGTDYWIAIDRCYSSGNVISHGTTPDKYTGGLIGYTYSANIADCYAFGNVLSNGSTVGGLLGAYSYGNVQRCISVADVVSGVSNVGGLIGTVTTSGTISQCSVSDDNGVNGVSMVGGLIGSMNSGTISQCYSISDVNGTYDDIGGLVGYNNGTITNCYSSGDVNGLEYVGGFVGDSASSGNISLCYSTGKVTGTYNTGGFAASNSGICSNNNYWDIETSGWEISACGTGKTTNEMMQQSTYEPDWDFDVIWSINEGQGYPLLGFYTPTCGDPWHPYPVSDLNHDCKVDYLDFAIMAEHWLECTDPSCQ
jgi:hypothetical protein